MKGFIFVLVLWVLSTVSAGAISVDDFELARKTGHKAWDIMSTFLGGVGYGYSLGNADFARHGVSPLFCQPMKLGLSGDDYAGIVEGELENPKHKYAGSTDIGLVLVMGMKDVFPCRPGQNDYRSKQ